MAALRKASSYSKKKIRPYTRKSKSKQRAYIKTVPQLKIVKWNMGNLKAHQQGKHNYIIRMISDEKVILRDNAIEACRTLINKFMDKHAQGQYFFTIKVFPHHILRENKTAAGAGADRLSSGMKHSFGVTIGRAAIVNKGKEIFYISCENEKSARIAREVLRKIKSKVPCSTTILLKKYSK